MIRQSIIVVVLALVLGAGGDLRDMFLRDSDRVIYKDTCAYYAARSQGARSYQSKYRTGDFAVFLGQLCAAAEDSLDAFARVERARAVQVLNSMIRLRRTVAEMNAERTGDRHRPRVTPSGEFLIARRIGLMDAFEAWLDSGAEFSIASYP